PGKTGAARPNVTAGRSLWRHCECTQVQVEHYPSWGGAGGLALRCRFPGSVMVWVKRLLIALVALVVLVAVAVGALILLVDPNDYKQTLEDEVKARYNRSLAIDGDIRFSMLPSLGLEISGVALSEPGSNQMFAAMESARVSVAWWPLLSRHLVIEHLTINGVKANLVRDENGRFNFQDFLQNTPESSPEPESTQRDDDQP